jgi:hypothetical protein
MKELVLERYQGETFWVNPRTDERAQEENLCAHCGINRAQSGCVVLEVISQFADEGVGACVTRCRHFEPVRGVVAVLEREE